MSAGVANK